MRYRIIDNFLLKAECQEIIEISKKRLAPSKTWNKKNGESSSSDYRKSEQMFFKVGENELLKHLEQKIANLTNIPIENGEGLQVVHYTEGEYYQVHWDYFDPEWLGNRPVLDRGGQRLITVIIYLNTLASSGGETYFPRLNLKVEPKEGTALLWHNLDKNGFIDPSTLHEAKPVLRGEKWVATKWLREYKFK